MIQVRTGMSVYHARDFRCALAWSQCLLASESRRPGPGRRCHCQATGTALALPVAAAAACSLSELPEAASGVTETVGRRWRLAYYC